MGGKLRDFVRKRKWKIKVKTWMLWAILVPLVFVDATLLRLNHIKMTELRDEVLVADEEGDEDRLTNALGGLKEFVFSNVVINVVEENGVQKITFGTGPFYLAGQYMRAATKALEKAEKEMSSDENPNGNIYSLAGETCRALAIQNGWRWDNANFINCMLSEIQKYPAAAELQDTMIASLPSTELYRREYASPLWTPTLVGFTILVTILVMIIIMVRVLIWIVLRLSLLFI